MHETNCPNCNDPWNGEECFTCGFADDLPQNEYKTPEGSIVQCTEEQAFEQGLILICPVCCYNIVVWWEMDDHGCCIECWHRNHTQRLTRKA